jgi:hypothetical protein
LRYSAENNRKDEGEVIKRRERMKNKSKECVEKLCKCQQPDNRKSRGKEKIKWTGGNI